MGVKMNFRIITKNLAADLKKGHPKIHFRDNGTQEVLGVPSDSLRVTESVRFASITIFEPFRYSIKIPS